MPLNKPEIHVYSRPGCHLCEELLEAMLPMVRDRASVEVRNVDERRDWQLDYGERIPVVEIDGRTVCQFRLDASALMLALTTAAS